MSDKENKEVKKDQDVETKDEICDPMEVNDEKKEIVKDIEIVDSEVQENVTNTNSEEEKNQEKKEIVKDMEIVDSEIQENVTNTNNEEENNVEKKVIIKDIEIVDSEMKENVTNTNNEEKNIEKKEKVEPDSSSKGNEIKDENFTEASAVECDSTTITLPVDGNAIPQNTKTKWKTTEDGLIDVEDSDDYLFYLEEILQRIHKSFYDKYDTMDAGSVPDLKTVIPAVKVLYMFYFAYCKCYF